MKQKYRYCQWLFNTKIVFTPQKRIFYFFWSDMVSRFAGYRGFVTSSDEAEKIIKEDKINSELEKIRLNNIKEAKKIYKGKKYFYL